jgi:hypothetical protein
MADLSEQAAMTHLRERLARTYAEIPPERVAAAVQHAQARFEKSPIRDFVPLLVERRAREELCAPGSRAAQPNHATVRDRVRPGQSG